MITTTAASTVGAPFTGVTVDLERGKILEFAEATRSTHAAYRDAERPVVPPTYLCFEGFVPGSARPDLQALPAEQDCRFFGPPPRAGDRLNVHSRGSESEQLTEFRDAEGRLIADSWTHGSATDAIASGLLANYATDWLGPESVRRFRTRFLEPVAAGDTLDCSGEVLQEYVQDGEPRVDVVLTATRPGGAVAAKAWATFARAS
ncbi:FAS1-like dehydratase domain-containing protein [Rhodococcus daqingensis]|uniref:MaoC family dehydratase N-terminal domain-containing protein n=1 Tax=Rhodococcus daqingensis TaxID=2479363 RepID=A0ABW2RX86_9NOCA